MSDDLFIRAIPGGTGGYYYSYDVFWRGMQILTRSHDPECEAARVLARNGVKGWVVVRDLETGNSRLRLNVCRMKGLCFREDSRGMSYVKYRKLPVIPKWLH